MGQNRALGSIQTDPHTPTLLNKAYLSQVHKKAVQQFDTRRALANLWTAPPPRKSMQTHTDLTYSSTPSILKVCTLKSAPPVSPSPKLHLLPCKTQSSSYSIICFHASNYPAKRSFAQNEQASASFASRWPSRPPTRSQRLPPDPHVSAPCDQALAGLHGSMGKKAIVVQT